MPLRLWLPSAALVLAAALMGQAAMYGQAAPSPDLPVYESGIASWYGAPFHGRLTASGAVFDKNELTAAHKSLPFGTIVLVRNLDNASTVQVRINDRGPFVAGRIIDLSEAAGRLLGLDRSGLARVSLHIVSQAPQVLNPPPKRIQLGSFGVAANARAAAERAARAGYEAKLETEGRLTRVVVYVAATQLAAALAALREAGFGSMQVSDAKP